MRHQIKVTEDAPKMFALAKLLCLTAQYQEVFLDVRVV